MSNELSLFLSLITYYSSLFYGKSTLRFLPASITSIELRGGGGAAGAGCGDATCGIGSTIARVRFGAGCVVFASGCSLLREPASGIGLARSPVKRLRLLMPVVCVSP